MKFLKIKNDAKIFLLFRVTIYYFVYLFDILYFPFFKHYFLHYIIFLPPSILSDFSACAGLQVLTQSTHQLMNCYLQLKSTWIHTVSKFCLHSSWITGLCRNTRQNEDSNFVILLESRNRHQHIWRRSVKSYM